MKKLLPLRPWALSLVLLLIPTALTWGQQPEPSLDNLEQQAFKHAVAVASPSVVRIETIGGLEKVGQLLLGDGPTSGVVVSADGYILSSAFNFVRQPTSILVTTPSGKRAAAKIVARDHSRMLVLLKVNSQESFPVAPLAPREDLQVGQWAIAIGRTLSAETANVSVGIISATNRISAVHCTCSRKPECKRHAKGPWAHGPMGPRRVCPLTCHDIGSLIHADFNCRRMLYLGSISDARTFRCGNVSHPASSHLCGGRV